MATPAAADTILIIEDDVDQQFLLEQVAEQADWTIHVESSMHDALEYLATGPTLSVVLADLHLSDASGVDSLEAVVHASSAPVIVRTAHVTHDIKVAASRLGVAELLDKGDGIAVLVEAVARVGSAAADTPSVVETVSGPIDFQRLTDRILDDLRTNVPMDSWLIAQVRGDDFVVVDARGSRHGLERGEVLRWSSMPCFRMVAGAAHVVEDVGASDVYGDCHIREPGDLGAYIGVPLVLENGDLFGTICAFNATPMSGLVGQSWMFELLGRTLGSALAFDLDRTGTKRMLEIAQAATRSDVLTGLGNRRALERYLRSEAARCDRHGLLSAIVAIDLDNLKVINDTAGHAAGDVYIQRAATALDRCLRASDAAFRPGGDEFVVVLTQITEAASASIVTRIRERMSAAGVSAAVGIALRRPGTSYAEALEAADRAMYDDKRLRRTREDPGGA